MHVMMSKEQFEVLKQKAKNSGGEVENEPPEINIKEDDDTHGTLDTDDVLMNYYYNSQEGRLYLSVAKRKSLAAYVAGDNICDTYVMELLSQLPNPNPKPKSRVGTETGVGKPSKPPEEPSKSEEGGSEGEEKKDQSQSQPTSQ